MSYTEPTPADLVARYPEFTVMAVPRVQVFLDDAGRSVDNSWFEADYIPAIVALAAHMMTLEGEPARTIAGTGATTGIGAAEEKRRKVGDVDVEVVTSADFTSGTSGSGWVASLKRTVYGQQYLSLLNVNQPAVAYV